MKIYNIDEVNSTYVSFFSTRIPPSRLNFYNVRWSMCYAENIKS